MKARIKAIDSKGTSINFSTSTWIDSNNILHQAIIPNGGLELLETAEPIDWEQRRYEIAKEVLVSSFSTHMERTGILSYVRSCVRVADVLIEELKGGKK